MTRPVLRLSYDEHLDWLELAPFGVIMDRQGPDRWRGVCENFGYFLDRPDGTEIGFTLHDYSEFDEDDEEFEEIFSGPRFDVPVLGLFDVSAGQIALAAAPFLNGDSTIDRFHFCHAMNARGELALAHWYAALEAGNLMAHYGAGYTQLDLGRPHLAYRHLRAYTELVSRDPWAWAFRAKAALAIGESAEARHCCEQAIELEDVYDELTDAREVLAAMDL